MGDTVEVDADRLAEARRLTGTSDAATLVRAALDALIERETARRLARLSATEPELGVPTRRRPA